MNDTQNHPDDATLAEIGSATERLRATIGRVVVGQQAVIEQLLMAILARGHCILEGVPGLAKTLLVRTLADSLHLSFHRIQFTPDLMPSDITGTEVLEEDKTTGQRVAHFLEGPIFANLLLADEINRTPPKTQAALLEAMQERQVTAAGRTLPMPDPFFVLATQNPIEQEGTYPLPEAQQDRFMFKIIVDYPSYDEEFAIAETTTSEEPVRSGAILSAEEIIRFQHLVRRIPAPAHVIHYALRLVRATRPNADEAPDFVRDWVSWGAGPRAVQFLLLGAKARAALDGRAVTTCDDVASLAHPVLRHRLLSSFVAEAEGLTPDRVIERLLETIPKQGDTQAVKGLR